MIFLKILSLLVLLFATIIINYLLFFSNKKSEECKKIANNNKNDKEKKFFEICVLIIIGVFVVFFLFDYFLIKNEYIDYLAFSILLSFLLSITFEDIKTKLMDTRVIIGYFILFLIYRIIFLDFTIFMEGFIGFALSLIIMLIAYFFKKNSIGFGDVEVIAACGMIIGFPNIFHFLFKAFLFVFIAGLILTITKKKKLLSELPLAPFLLIATII